MEITRISLLTLKKNTLEINISSEELLRIENGEFVQRVVPHLSPEIREFLISGITPEEWKDHFGSEEDS
ncbi:hypothetical protein [Chitinophaga sp. YR573]|uniref:hypothetical protein n=1 Tax=Chitinophaga sp. YR573 TaxID=1881040 RepID=UPI00115F9778|nr:hypothetical protein [Chitinophaga sp. YR573]